MTEHINLRELALSVLLSVTRDGEFSHIALKQVLDKYQYLSKQERSFLTRICEGTLEQMIWIDYVINQFSSVRVNKMKPVIRCIIRIGVYELKFMSSVPQSAACNEAVKLAKKKGFGNLSGFVNGVLRKVSRSLEELKLPDKETEPEVWLSVTYSMPEWIVREWRKSYSMEQVEEMLKAFLTRTPTSIRVNTARISPAELTERLERQQITVKEQQGAPDGLYIEEYDYLNAIKEFREGLFYVQDASSMQVAHRAGIKPGDHVIDVCSAPGGKSIHMAELLKGTGMVEARDLTDYKVDLIRDNVLRSGLQNIRAEKADACELRTRDAERADIVLADLPCSGLGVIGKKKDIKYKITQEQLASLSGLQREILHTVQSYVKPGGVLLYSTCTINPGENEENTAWFLQQHPDYTLDFQEQLFPEAGKNDGFYMARFIKTEEHGKSGH